MTATRRGLALTCVALAACGGGDGTAARLDASAGAIDAAPYDPFEPALATVVLVERIGGFGGGDAPSGDARVELVDGPARPFHVEVARAGECRLLAYQPAFCDEPCAGICLATGCTPYPRSLDAGDLAVTGATTPFTIARDAAGRYPAPALPADLFAAGAELAVSAAGGADLAAFTVAATAPAPLVTPIASPTALPAADDVDLTWTPADDGAALLLTIASANGGHGEPYARIIECASADDGAITVPAAFVAELGALSGTPCFVGNECPPATLTRYRHGTVATARGEVALWLASERMFYVSHAPP